MFRLSLISPWQVLEVKDARGEVLHYALLTAFPGIGVPLHTIPGVFKALHRSVERERLDDIVYLSGR